MRLYYKKVESGFFVFVPGSHLIFFTNNHGDGFYFLDQARELIRPSDFSVRGLSDQTAKRKLRKLTLDFLSVACQME